MFCTNCNTEQPNTITQNVENANNSNLIKAALIENINQNITFQTQYKPIMCAKVHPNYIGVFVMFCILVIAMQLEKWFSVFNSPIITLALGLICIFLLLLKYKSEQIPFYVYDKGFIYGYNPEPIGFDKLESEPQIGSKLLFFNSFPHMITLKYRTACQGKIIKLRVAFETKEETTKFISLYDSYRDSLKISSQSSP